MNSVLAAINQSDHHDDESEQAFVASLPKILDKQANEVSDRLLFPVILG